MSATGRDMVGLMAEFVSHRPGGRLAFAVDEARDGCAAHTESQQMRTIAGWS